MSPKLQAYLSLRSKSVSLLSNWELMYFPGQEFVLGSWNLSDVEKKYVLPYLVALDCVRQNGNRYYLTGKYEKLLEYSMKWLYEGN